MAPRSRCRLAQERSSDTRHRREPSGIRARRATRPAYVQLFIFLHGDVAAARAKFEASSRDPFSAGSVPPPKPIGDEAFVVRLEMPAIPGGLPFESTTFALMFRYANVVQSVSVVGARDTVTIADLMEIAERQRLLSDDGTPSRSRRR